MDSHLILYLQKSSEIESSGNELGRQKNENIERIVTQQFFVEVFCQDRQDIYLNLLIK